MRLIESHKLFDERQDISRRIKTFWTSRFSTFQHFRTFGINDDKSRKLFDERLDIQKRVSPAGTGETSSRVQAYVLAAAVVGGAFVYVFAVRLQSSLLVTVVAYALIRAHHVLADAVRTDTAGSRALVDVLAGLLVRSQLVARRALTLKTALGVDAGSSSAQSRCLLALVYV